MDETKQYLNNLGWPYGAVNLNEIHLVIKDHVTAHLIPSGYRFTPVEMDLTLRGRLQQGWFQGDSGGAPAELSRH